MGLKHRSSMLAICHRQGPGRAPGSGREHAGGLWGKILVGGLGPWKEALLEPEARWALGAPAHIRECASGLGRRLR